MAEDWSSYEKLVLAELKRLSESMGILDKEMSELSNQIAALKVQAGIWGIIGGAIPVAVALLIGLLSRHG